MNQRTVCALFFIAALVCVPSWSVAAETCVERNNRLAHEEEVMAAKMDVVAAAAEAAGDQKKAENARILAGAHRAAAAVYRQQAENCANVA